MLNGIYNPKPSKATISNAMDVGNPSNFVRILELYNHDLSQFKKDFSSYSFSDEETKHALLKLYNKTNYIAEPLGVVGYLGLKKELKNYSETIGVVLETAHPIKFLDVVEPILNIKLPIPSQIESVLNKEKNYIAINNYQDLKEFLLKKE
jgi:threonine synthase